MPWDKAILAKDVRQASKDLPTSFRFRNKQYNDRNFNPGDYTLDPVSGGLIEGVGEPTIVLPLTDLPKRRPEPLESLSVLWDGHWVELIIVSFRPGLVSGRIVLKSESAT